MTIYPRPIHISTGKISSGPTDWIPDTPVCYQYTTYKKTCLLILRATAGYMSNVDTFNRELLPTAKGI